MNPHTLATILISNGKASVHKTVGINYVPPDDLSSAATGVLGSLSHPDIERATGENLKDCNAIVRVVLHNENEPPDAPVKCESASSDFGAILHPGQNLNDVLETTTLPDSRIVDEAIEQAEKWAVELAEYYIRDFQELTGTAADIRPAPSVEELE